MSRHPTEQENQAEKFHQNFAAIAQITKKRHQSEGDPNNP